MRARRSCLDARRATGRVQFEQERAPNIFWTDVFQQGPPERLAVSENERTPGSWSHDGPTLAFVEQNPSTGRDIWLLPLDHLRAARALINSPSDESAPRFSPDGRALAYVSNETGRNEVYVRGLTDQARTRLVSSDGGTEPVWARDGSALFYRRGTKMMVASIAAGSEMLFAKPPRCSTASSKKARSMRPITMSLLTAAS